MGLPMTSLALQDACHFVVIPYQGLYQTSAPYVGLASDLSDLALGEEEEEEEELVEEVNDMIPPGDMDLLSQEIEKER